MAEKYKKAPLKIENLSEETTLEEAEEIFENIKLEKQEGRKGIAALFDPFADQPLKNAEKLKEFCSGQVKLCRSKGELVPATGWEILEGNIKFFLENPDYRASAF